MQKYIYVLLTRTPTKFGSLIRKIAKQQYNHASIALDDKFNHVYAFARKKHNTPLVAGLVRESLDRFTLKTEEPVPAVIFRIPVKSEQYAFISNLINNMLDNTDYVYNLFSVLSQPVFKGFATPYGGYFYTLNSCIKKIQKRGHQLQFPRFLLVDTFITIAVK